MNILSSDTKHAQCRKRKCEWGGCGSYKPVPHRPDVAFHSSEK